MPIFTFIIQLFNLVQRTTLILKTNNEIVSHDKIIADTDWKLCFSEVSRKAQTKTFKLNEDLFSEETKDRVIESIHLDMDRNITFETYSYLSSVFDSCRFLNDRSSYKTDNNELVLKALQILQSHFNESSIIHSTGASYHNISTDVVHAVDTYLSLLAEYPTIKLSVLLSVIDHEICKYLKKISWEDAIIRCMEGRTLNRIDYWSGQIEHRVDIVGFGFSVAQRAEIRAWLTNQLDQQVNRM